MSRMPWATYLWPGLPQLWAGGLISGLVLAVGFGVLVNLLLTASFVWVELVSTPHLRLGWLATGALWSVATVISLRTKLGTAASREADSAEVLFRGALSEYLQGSWFEAEALLGRLLQSRPADVEGRLLLATLLRRTGRHDGALDQLARLERLRDAEIWKLEIAAERRWIAAAEPERTPADESAPGESALPGDSRQAA